MNRWQQRLAALQGNCPEQLTAPPSPVQNVQYVQNASPEPAFEHSEQIEHGTEPAAEPPPPLDRARAAWDDAEAERAAIVEHDGIPAPIAADAGKWRNEYANRAAHREVDGQRSRAEAERLAWGEAQWRWHKEHGERVSRELCAGCRRPIGTEGAFDLIDGNRVHDRAGHECLIRHGERWHTAATRALIGMGLQPPAGEDTP